MKCPNCETDIKKDDKFCYACGQRNVSMRISLKEFISTFVQVYFSFDTRFFRTIGPMLFKPGYLSNKFFEGKRKRYLDPLRFYVFVSFFVFLLAPLADVSFLNVDASTDLDAAVGNDQVINITTAPGDEKEVETGKFIDALKQIVENKDKINANILRYISIALFFLMPLFALINYLIFYRKKNFYLEHLILSFHIHTFFLILSIFGIVISLISGYRAIGPILFCLSIFTIISMKNYYKTSWGGVIWRFFLSIGIYTFVLGITVSVIALLAIYSSGAQDIFTLGS